MPPRIPIDAPLGFSGRSSVIPHEVQTDPHFVPIEDRWRIGFPEWDRYGKGDAEMLRRFAPTVCRSFGADRES